MSTTRTKKPTDPGCCVAAPATATPTQITDLLQARSIAQHLPALGIIGDRIAAAVDADARAAVVRVDSRHGLFGLIIPPVGRAFPVMHNARRIGALNVRRIPANSDSSIATHLAAFLRDRAAL
ncbi:hypothetical protein ACFVVA_36930 [Kitasatospora sp. NPDC058048]|uniref:hypothetical protein n=1 Tax=Kitasatospora sp. NPDC058048 TaxID=3346313 RepID=UPI0036DF71C6